MIDDNHLRAADAESATPRSVAGTQLSVLPTPAPARSGIADVDAALARLGDLSSTGGDLAEHVVIYEDVHRKLASALEPDDRDPGTDEPAHQV